MELYNFIVHFFRDGGFFLYPIAIIFVVGVSISIERFVYLTMETIKNRELWNDVVPHLGAGNFKQVIALTSKSTSAIATVLNYGVARVANTASPRRCGKGDGRKFAGNYSAHGKAYALFVLPREHRDVDRVTGYGYRLDRRVRRDRKR